VTEHPPSTTETVDPDGVDGAGDPETDHEIPAGDPVRGATADRTTRRLPRSWVTATSVAVLVVGIVVASAVGVLAFTSDDGAESPEAATRQMIDAVRRNDLVGIVELLPPGERKALRDPVAQIASQLQNLRLVGRLDPSRVPGLAFTFDDLQLRGSELSRDVQAVDVVSGRMRAEWMGGGTPLTDHARQILAREWGITIDPVDASYNRDFATDHLRLVTVKEGGGWHVSLAYTVAEALRAEQNGRLPDMGEGPLAVGANVPAEAVTDLVRAYTDGDPERLVTLMYPDEARALYDYAPTFVPGAREAARQADADGLYEVQLNKIETAVEGTGERRRVHITNLDIDIRDELHKQHLWWSDGCFHTDQRINDDDEPYAKTDSCSKDRPRLGDDTAPRDNPVSNLAIFGGGADLPTFTVIERNGRWFVSPVHTLADSLADTGQTMQTDDLDGYAERWAATWDAGAGQGMSGDPVRPTAGDVAADPSKAGARGKALADRCAQLTTGVNGEAVTTACIRRLVANNRVKAEDLPPAAQAVLR
jgi:hypothetical protein